MQIDCYGFVAISQYFRRKKLDAYKMKSKDGILYVCFHEKANRPIHRLDTDENGGPRLTWAYGKWEDAENLRYIPINETMEVSKEEDL